MAKRALFLIIGVSLILSAVEGLVLSSFARADNFTLSGYTEVGERSTAEDYEEGGRDDDYVYQKYHLKLEQEVFDRLSYDISSFVYDKDYKSCDSLDNISRTFKLNSSYFLRKLKEESLELDFKLKHKQRRYKNSPRNEYDEIRVVPALTFKEKDLYRVNFALGINSFDYLSEGEKDPFKIFAKIGARRYLKGRDLRLISSYRIENTEEERIDRKRTKQEVLTGFDYLFDFAWIHKLILRLGWGQRDAKEDEERDEDYDYGYRRYYTKTEHRINPRLKTNLKYQYFKKNYISADYLDYRSFYIQNGWDYEIFEDEKQRLDLDFSIEHKDVHYHLKSGNDYLKESVELKVTYRRKRNYKLQAALEQNFYDFNDSGNDKKRYSAKLSAEKLFLDRDLVLSIDFKYRYTDYKQKDDKDKEAVRVAFRYRF